MQAVHSGEDFEVASRSILGYEDVSYKGRTTILHPVAGLAASFKPEIGAALRVLVHTFLTKMQHSCSSLQQPICMSPVCNILFCPEYPKPIERLMLSMHLSHACQANIFADKASLWVGRLYFWHMKCTTNAVLRFNA